MPSRRIFLTATLLLMFRATFFLEAADPATATERSDPKQDPHFLRRYGSSAFRKPASQLAYSPDGRWLVASDGRNIWLMDAKTGETQGELSHRYPRYAGFAFSPDGKSIVAGAPDGPTLWELKENAVPRLLEKWDRPASGQWFATSPNRQWRVGLRKIGPGARLHLEAALKNEDLSPRVGFRIKLLLSALESKTSPELAAVRAVQLLEWIGTPKARGLIKDWANEPGRLGKEAKVAANRFPQSK